MTTSARTGCSPPPRSAATRRTPSRGNADFDQIVDWVATRCRSSGARCSRPPSAPSSSRRRSRASTRTAPDCEGLEDRDLGYCAADATVYVDETDLATPAYEEIGDFALATALALPYSLAVRDAGGPVDRRRGGHPLGRLPDRLVRGPVVQRRVRRLARGVHQPRRHRRGGAVPARRTACDDEVFPNLDASGFELVGAFRTGFLEGGDACELASLRKDAVRRTARGLARASGWSRCDRPAPAAASEAWRRARFRPSWRSWRPGAERVRDRRHRPARRRGRPAPRTGDREVTIVGAVDGHGRRAGRRRPRRPRGLLVRDLPRGLRAASSSPSRAATSASTRTTSTRRQYPRRRGLRRPSRWRPRTTPSTASRTRRARTPTRSPTTGRSSASWREATASSSPPW